MTNRESLQLAAFERALALMDQNLPIIQGIPAIMESKVTLLASIKNIRLINVEVEKGVGGIYINFNEAKNTLIEVTLAVQGALIAYCIVQNNNDLLQKVSFSLTEIKNSGNEGIYDKGKLIHDLALPLNAVLTDEYQMPETMISQLNTALDEYERMLPLKGLTKQESVAWQALFCSFS